MARYTVNKKKMLQGSVMMGDTVSVMVGYTATKHSACRHIVTIKTLRATAAILW